MGCYDTIRFHCPKCDAPYDAQSKGGACVMAGYNVDCVPLDVACDANRHAPYTCYQCGKVWRFSNNVALKLEEA